MTTRQELIDEAVVIRSETLANRNTAERVGKNLQDITERLAFPPDAPDGLWVIEATGSDDNDGSEATPYASLDRALEDWGPSVEGNPTIYLYPSVAATGHVSEEFWKPRIYRGKAKIVGVGNIEVNPAETLTSYSSLVYTFAGQTWTAGQWSGYDLEATSEADFPEPSNRRTILWNTADTITVAHAHRTPGFARYPIAGDAFRVVEPAVKIDTSAVGGERRDLFGGQGVDTRRSFLEVKSSLRLENVELRAPDGNTDAIALGGTFYAYGLHITKNTASQLSVVIDRGVLQAGEFLNEGPIQFGWGLSTRDRGGNAIRPDVDFGAGHKGSLFYSGGGIQVRGGSRELLQGCMCDGAGRTGFPHAACYSEIGHVFTASGNDPNIMFRSFDDGYDLESSTSHIEIYKPIQHLGAGGIARARTNGHITLGAEPVILGSLGIITDALYGGKIRITGWDGEALGDVSAGQIAPVPRAQAIWAVNEGLEGSESSWIYRTS